MFYIVMRNSDLKKHMRSAKLIAGNIISFIFMSIYWKVGLICMVHMDTGYY